MDIRNIVSCFLYNGTGILQGERKMNHTSSGKKQRWHLWPYVQTLPGILYYQILSVLILTIALRGVRVLSSALMTSAGHEAVTTGDFGFVFTTWQGWLLIVLALGVLCLYTIFNLNVTILYSRMILAGKKEKTGKLLKDAVKAFKGLTGIRGLFLILYMAIIVPLVGIGVTTRLTANLTIPNFISSVIVSTPKYLIPFSIFLVFMLIQGLRYLFVFHAVVLDGLKAKEAVIKARGIMKAHWKNFIPHYILFLIVLLASAVFFIGICLAVPDLLVSLISEHAAGSKFFSVFMALLDNLLFWYFYEVMSPLATLELTRYYRMYTENAKIYVPYAPKSRHAGRVVRISILILVLLGLSGIFTAFYDELFPLESTVGTVAHRTGGTLAAENSAEGIVRASAYGVIGCETDVQRTADGYYIINHDDDFKRLYGVNKKPSEMTLAEIEELQSADGEKVPTLVQLLDTAKENNVKLYIELKGETADEQMVDDVVQIVKEKDMIKDTALISLKYDVLDYAESTYPEFETGYLYFMSFGDTTKLNVDDLIIEEQLASGAGVSALHLGGKKVLVWTVNEEEEMNRILAGEADGMITDQVEMAARKKEEMKKRDYRERAYDRISWWLS